jgi:hypothetical protein
MSKMKTRQKTPITRSNDKKRGQLVVIRDNNNSIEKKGEDTKRFISSHL